MITISDPTLYHHHRAIRDNQRGPSLHHTILPMLLFGSVGATTWAIRGTTGWGGIDGTLVPGLAWAILWYYLARRNGIDARPIILWLGLGIAIGGDLGYGQYTGWIRGRFEYGDGTLPIAPAIGYLWFIICGIGWGATGGIVLGWALNSRVSIKQWAVRALLLLALLTIIYNRGALIFGSGIVDTVGAWCAQHTPALLFPNAHMGIYTGELDRHLARTVYTNTQNALVVLWWIAALLAAALQRDRPTLIAGTIIGAGFGIGFAQSAAWCLGYVHHPQFIDWWKVWELNAGFNLGVLYVIVINYATRQLDHAHTPDGVPTTPAPPCPVGPSATSAALALAGFILIFGAGYEYFFWTGLALATFYVITVALAHASHTTPEDLVQRRRSMALAFTAFFLIFMLLHGVTSTLGVVLGCYTHDAISQYDWPPARILLMIAGLIPLIAVTLISLAKMLQHPRIPQHPSPTAHRLHIRLIDLITTIGIVGAISIWPDKITILYATFTALALVALTRINQHLDQNLGQRP